MLIQSEYFPLNRYYGFLMYLETGWILFHSGMHIEEILLEPVSSYLGSSFLLINNQMETCGY